ncbi:MAG TPA: AMP-binding protein [Thermoanaerobaculia bacterium]|nr:AMP-binding protein [Thermoanaerobaculia bacterium]
MLDFASDETHLLLNPRLPADERARLETMYAAAPRLRAHVWLSTSGTTGSLKLVALSKQAILASAAAVNRHLESTSRDVWCCVLPTFHVGGLGIYARAFLSGARVIASSWDPHSFVSLCNSEGVTLASLVPAQVRDLRGLRVPSSLRAIVVGGGAFADEHAGWPLLPSYGMTETASQVATAKPGNPDLVLLDHIEARIEAGHIALRGESLLTGYMVERRALARRQLPGGLKPAAPHFEDPKRDGWFVTPDLGSIDGRILHVRGRSGDFVKIGGESVDLSRLDRILAEIEPNAAIVAAADERLGHVIHLAFAAADSERIVTAFNERVLPFERIRAVHRVDAIPRTPLGKLKRSALARGLGI